MGDDDRDYNDYHFDLNDPSYWENPAPVRLWSKLARSDPHGKWADQPQVISRQQEAQNHKYYDREWAALEEEGADGAVFLVDNRAEYRKIGTPKLVSSSVANLVRQKLYEARDARLGLEVLYDLIIGYTKAKGQAISRATVANTLRSMIHYLELDEDTRNGKRFVFLTQHGKREYLKAAHIEAKQQATKDMDREAELAAPPALLARAGIKKVPGKDPLAGRPDAKWICPCDWGVYSEKQRVRRLAEAKEEYRKKHCVVGDVPDKLVYAERLHIARYDD